MSHATTAVVPRSEGWLEVDGTRVTLFPVLVGLTAFHRAYFDEVGQSAAQCLYLSGLRTAVAWRDRLQGDDLPAMMQSGLDQMRDAGYGDFRLTSHEAANRFTVESDNAIEAWAFCRQHAATTQPVCHYVAGLFAGLWSLAALPFDVPTSNVECWEVECRAAGAPCCRFEIGPAEELTRLGLHDARAQSAVRWTMQELSTNLLSSNRQVTTLHERLAERENAYHHLLDYMNDHLVVLDPDKKLIFCNRRFLDNTGLTVDQAIGSSPLQRIHEQDRDRVSAIYDRLFAGESIAETYVYRASRGDATIFLESSARAITDKGKVAAIEIIGRDVTEREQARHALEQAHQALVEKQMMADIDLRVAKRVHESLLPRRVVHEAFELDLKYVPHGRVGGDYGHINLIRDEYCVLTICDVSGHGMASALLAARVSSHLQLACANEPDPLVITTCLNDFLMRYFADSGLFVTFFAVSVHLPTREARYSGAGHPGPLLRRTNGTMETLASRHLPMGIIENYSRSDTADSVMLQPGDRLLIYTDGVTETRNVDQQELKAEGLARWFDEGAAVPVSELGDFLLRRVEDFRYGPRADDMTILLFETR